MLSAVESRTPPGPPLEELRFVHPHADKTIKHADKANNFFMALFSLQQLAVAKYKAQLLIHILYSC
jgi:hypothetical protein